MEVITFSPDMDLSSKEAGDVFRLKLYGIEYDVKRKDAIKRLKHKK